MVAPRSEYTTFRAGSSGFKMERLTILPETLYPSLPI